MKFMLNSDWYCTRLYSVWLRAIFLNTVFHSFTLKLDLHLILVEFSVPTRVSNKACLTPVGDSLGFIYVGFLKPVEVDCRCFCSEEIHNLIWGLGRRKLNDSVPIKNLQFYITKICTCRLEKSCNILVHRDFVYGLYLSNYYLFLKKCKFALTEWYL